MMRPDTCTAMNSYFTLDYDCNMIVIWHTLSLALRCIIPYTCTYWCTQTLTLCHSLAFVISKLYRKLKKNLQKILQYFWHSFNQFSEIILHLYTGETVYCTRDMLYVVCWSLKKLFTLEGKLPSAFVHPLVGEGLCTWTDFVQNSRRE
jgi:hypothetical protein